MAQFMGTPSMLTVAETGTDFIKLTWDTPAAAQGITTYEIHIKSVCLSVPQLVYTGNSHTSYKITDLKPNTTYQVQIRAVYSNDSRGSFSDGVTIATNQQRMIPVPPSSMISDAAPGKPRVKSSDLNCITLEWDPPQSKTDYIMCYEVNYKQKNTSSWETCNSDNFEPNIDFLDLDENATYVAKVCAVFGVTTGPFSKESDPFSMKTNKKTFMPHTNEYSNMPLPSAQPASLYESIPGNHTYQQLDHPTHNHPTPVSMPHRPDCIAFPDEMEGHRTSTPSDNTVSSGPNVVNMQPVNNSPFYRPQNIQENPTPVSMPYNPACIAFPEEMGGQGRPDTNSPFYRPQNIPASPASTPKQLSIKPFNVKVKCVSTSKVKITWKFNEEKCRHCEIGYKKNGKGGWQQEVTEEPTTSHMLEIDDDALTYSIRVRSVLEEGPGPYSETVEVGVKEDKEQDDDAHVPPRTHEHRTSNRKADENMSHKLAEKPGRPQIKDSEITHESVAITWKEPRQSNNITNYEILFKTQEETKWVNEITDDDDTSYTVYGLKSGMKYEFQTKAVFNFDRSGPKSEISRQVKTHLAGATCGAVAAAAEGRAAVGGSGRLYTPVPEEEPIPITPQKPNKPQQPASKSVTSDSITIEWSDSDSEGIEFYEVQYKIEDDDDWKVTKTTSGDRHHTVKGLLSGSEYSFRVRGVNELGKSKHSKESFPIQTKRTAARQVMKQAKKLTSNQQPAQYLIKITKISRDTSKKIQHMSFGSPSKTPHQQEKTIMVVGATGSGKSTLINGMLNYLLDVKWDDNFRYVIIEKDAEKPGANQAHSQTQFITCYKIHAVDGSKQTYTLNIVDTPGFGDTSGIARDKELVEQIRTLFGTPGNLGLQTIDAVCFVAPAAQARLTPTQKYIFDSVLSMFGKDIADNIVTLLTFADGSEPPVLVSLREAEVPFTHWFTFNNSALFENNVLENRSGKKSFSKMFWDMGLKSFEEFFDELGLMSSKSLTLSAEVLEERKHLEAKVEGLQLWITNGLSKVETLRQEKQILEQHDVDINANKNFKYEVEEVTQVKINLKPGEYVTNCLTCNRTCHFPCAIPQDQEKYNCAAMNYQMAQNVRTCTVCPGKCIWNVHVNNPYKFDFKTETKKKTYDEVRKKLEKATGKKKDQLNVVDEIKKEINSLQGNIVNTISDITNALRRLNEIALKPNPLNNIDYIDLLLASEEQEAKEGYKGRIVALKKVREQAVILQRAEKKDLTFFKVD